MAASGGRPRRKYEAETARLVESLAQFGVPQKQIAAMAKVSPDVMANLYAHELEVGAGRANAKVAQTLYRKAVEKEDTAALIFWCKTRMGFSEKSVVDNISSDGSMSPKALAVDPRLFSGTQLRALRGLDEG